MKKLTLLLSAFVLLLASCDPNCHPYIDHSNHMLIIKSVERRSATAPGAEKYRVEFINTDWGYYTDTLYQPGDTLQLEKFTRK